MNSRVLFLVFAYAWTVFASKRNGKSASLVKRDASSEMSTGFTIKSVSSERTTRSIRSAIQSHQLGPSSQNQSLVESASYPSSKMPENLLVMIAMRKWFKLNMVVFGTLMVYTIAPEYGNPRLFPAHAIFALIDVIVECIRRPVTLHDRVGVLVVQALVRLESPILQSFLTYSQVLSQYPPDILTLLGILVIDIIVFWLLSIIH